MCVLTRPLGNMKVEGREWWECLVKAREIEVFFRAPFILLKPSKPSGPAWVLRPSWTYPPTKSFTPSRTSANTASTQDNQQKRSATVHSLAHLLLVNGLLFVLFSHYPYTDFPFLHKELLGFDHKIFVSLPKLKFPFPSHRGEAWWVKEIRLDT